MSDYIVTGKKGNGKSLVCVGKIRDALMAGRAVATNLDLKLDKLLPPHIKNVRCYRLPDYPSVEDMEALGMGSDKLDESSYGLIVVDECATFLNTREWGDKKRQPLLNWFVHSRKYRWETMFIAQNINQLDKQLREALADHHVVCKRIDKLRIPFLGPLTKHVLGFELRPPKVHVAAVRYGMEHSALITDRWTYRGVGLYAAYDTEQVFDPEYPHGLYSYLSPWHIAGRHGEREFRLRDLFKPAKPRRRELKPKRPIVALLQQLPPDERIKHLKRFQAAGVV
ncbi:MAG TPA: zonular occludens toxin domain-containing protein [Noviherbaspirillum sp.]|nr:zonular occludens toxin domain-containing protein [Noviherbaspirillum sp.]